MNVSRRINITIRRRIVIGILLGSMSFNTPTHSAEPITTATVVAAIGLPVMAALVNKLLERPRNAISGWLLSSIGVKPSASLDDAVEKIEKLNKKIDSLKQDVDASFAQLRCENYENLLSGAIKNINHYRNEFSNLIDASQPSSQKVRMDWALTVANNLHGIRKDIFSISDTLLGDDRAGGQASGLLAVCGEKLHLNWTQNGKIADERSYYGPLLKIQSYYYLQQISALHMLVNAKHFLATQEAKREGKQISEQLNLDSTVCGDINNVLQKEKPTDLSERQQLCFEAMRAPIDIYQRLLRQFTLIGAGYSYDINHQEQAKWISALNPKHFNGRGQLWVLNPLAYPNAGKTAYEARKLENTTFAGISGWRGAGSADWNALLDQLQWDQGEGYVDRNLNNQVGFKPFSYTAGLGSKTAQGKGAVIWMNEEVSRYWEDLAYDRKGKESFEGYCLLIPYSKRDKRFEGGGRPICSEEDMVKFLLPILSNEDVEINTSQSVFISNKWLNEAVVEPHFSFNGRLIANYNVISMLTPSGQQRKFYNGSWDSKPPSWVKSGKVPSHEKPSPLKPFNVMKRIHVGLNERSEQVIVPVRDVGSNELASCTKNRSWSNINGVPSMCGDNLDRWIALFMPPLKKEFSQLVEQ